MSTSKPSNSQRPSWTQQTERGSAWLIRLMTWIALTFGRTIARSILPFIALYFSLTSGKAKRASAQYLSRALGRRPKWLDFYLHIFYFASVILDRVYFLNARFKPFEFRLFGTEGVYGECCAGRGGFLIGAHLGSFEAISAAGHDMPDLKVSLVMYQAHAKKISQMMQAVNQRQNYEVIALGNSDSMIKVNDRLQNGGFIGMLADRRFGHDSSLLVPFLGEPARFPKGGFKLAATLKRPVYLMIGLYRGGNRYDIHFELLFDFSKTERNRSAAVDQAIQIYVERLEHYCRLAPYNWFNFFDVWEDNHE